MTIDLNPLLLIILFPLAGFVIILFLNKENKKAIRWTGFITVLDYIFILTMAA